MSNATQENTARETALEKNRKFIKACMECSTIKEIAEATGLSPNTVTQKRSKLNKEMPGLLPPLKRGGGPSITNDDILALVAEARGVTVEEVKAQVEAKREEMAEAEQQAEAEQTA